MTTPEDKKLSLVISSTLDSFGLSKNQIKLRSECLDEIATALSRKIDCEVGSLVTISGVGSSGEDVQVSGSDFDIMYTPSDVICVDEGIDDKGFIILGADYSKTAPGYIKVVSISIPDNLFSSEVMQSSSSSDPHTNRVFISSERMKRFRSHMFKYFVRTDGYQLSATGPALTFSDTDYAVSEIDHVLCIYFYGGNYLLKWAERNRMYAWPSHKVINEVSNMEGYIVPVGDKKAICKHWNGEFVIQQ